MEKKGAGQGYVYKRSRFTIKCEE